VNLNLLLENYIDCHKYVDNMKMLKLCLFSGEVMIVKCNWKNIMSDINQQNSIELLQSELKTSEWDEPIICRVEVDLPAWLSQLAGGCDWEVYSEEEEENCVSFAMRQGSAIDSKNTLKLAEVTLYHNGYAIVDVDGSFIFDGSLTSGASDCAHLTYYHAESGEKITLN